MFANRSSFDRLVRAIFITALLAIGASHAWGRQTSTPGRGAIRGAVTDQSGAVIASAYIYATNRETGAQYQTRSGPDGGFLLDQLPLAEYDLKVTAQGFSNTEMRIPLGLDSVSAPHNVQLDVALGVMTISVKMVVSTESYATVCIVCGYTYFSIPFNDLPLKDRDVQRLVFLQPVVTEHEGEFSIQGARPTNKSATIDDLNDREPAAGKFAASLSLDAINEFNSDASQAIELFGSSYGQDTGPELAAKSKTGSNSYHAQAYEFAGRTGMSANNFFTGRGGLARDQRRYDQLGGAFGGPVSLPGVFSGKDRVFFFISYEHTGDFERTGEQAVGLTESFLRKTAPIQGALFKTLLSEGRIPVASGIAARSFDLNGDGSPDLSEIGVRNSQRLGRDLGLVRLDFRISDRTQLSGIVNYDGANRSDGFENGVFSPGSPVTLRQHGSLFGFKLETVINPSMVNEAMIGGRNWRAA
ncbi:MAG TPA: carboxypeptidase-like regulatory domain-containing protein, partial [Blastocatellia bacterium]|nr:carboxypeptidase-like regulatory domain-containing protein [Blastocatellia bacterium]